MNGWRGEVGGPVNGFVNEVGGVHGGVVCVSVCVGGDGRALTMGTSALARTPD